MLRTARAPLHIKAHVVFGGVVLVYFPDRASGKIEWFGVKVRSAAAGLPLIRSRHDCRRLGGFTSAIDRPYTRRYSPRSTGGGNRT
jgi:hypothetical protein